MNKLIYIIVFAVTLAACQKSEHADHHDHEAMQADSTNTILYNQVMDIHDEVMPKMEDLYNKKKDLQSKLAVAKTDAEKKAIQASITRLDSVNDLMMSWMHEFNPPADTADQESSRVYLEAEMEKVKRVREAINQTLDTTKAN